MYYTTEDPTTREVARAAFIYGLSQAHRQAYTYTLLAVPQSIARQENIGEQHFDLIGTQRIVGERMVAGYSYGFAPLAFITSGEGFIGNENFVQMLDEPLQLEYTRRLLDSIEENS
jgi:hypothetical protein